jgi:hypothetical protein
MKPTSPVGQLVAEAERHLFTFDRLQFIGAAVEPLEVELDAAEALIDAASTKHSQPSALSAHRSSP